LDIGYQLISTMLYWETGTLLTKTSIFAKTFV
jgi:hypothetical protein